MIFRSHRRTIQNNNVKYVINDIPIEIVDTIKYLGYNITSNLSDDADIKIKILF